MGFCHRWFIENVTFITGIITNHNYVLFIQVIICKLSLTASFTKGKEYCGKKISSFRAWCFLQVLHKLHLSHWIIMNFLFLYIYVEYLLNCTLCFYNKVLFTWFPLFIQKETDSYPFISYSKNIFSSLKLIDALL